jgi:hypothetical protein
MRTIGYPLSQEQIRNLNHLYAHKRAEKHANMYKSWVIGIASGETLHFERPFSVSDTSGLKKGEARSYYRPEDCFMEDLTTEKKGSGLGLWCPLSLKFLSKETHKHLSIVILDMLPGNRPIGSGTYFVQDLGINMRYSKPSGIRSQLIWMSDNPVRNKINAVHNWVHNLKDTWHLGRQTSHLSVQTKLDSFFKPASLRSKTSITSGSSIDE